MCLAEHNAPALFQEHILSVLLSTPKIIWQNTY